MLGRIQVNWCNLIIVNAEESFEEEQEEGRSRRRYVKGGFRPSDTQEMRRLY